MMAAQWALWFALVASPPKVLTLDEALRTASGHYPQIVAAHANTMASEAAADMARAPLLPRVTGAGTYTRATGNFAPSAGALPSMVAGGGGGQATNGANFNTYNSWAFSAQVTQFLYDFGETLDHWRSTKANAESQRESEINTIEQVKLNVRTAFFNVRATRALVGVAEEAVDNQKHHLDQILAFVKIGRDPEINVATARTSWANAKVQLVTAQNNFLIAKAQLNQSMGVEQATDYDIADQTLGTVEGEDGDIEALAHEAKKARPDVIALERAVDAQAFQVRSAKEGYAPAFNAQMNLNDRGVQLNNLVWNWNVAVSVTVPIFDGLLTPSTVKQQQALLVQADAQLEQQKQQARLDCEQARLAVRAAKENIVGGAEALTNAREQLRLAQGRYKAGVGSVIELGDAQLAFTTAEAQTVQAEYNLAIARAQLLKALGRP